MVPEKVDSIITTISCTLYFSGLVLLIGSDILMAAGRLFHFMKGRLSFVVIKKKETDFDRSIRYMIAAVFGENSKITVLQLKLLTLVLFLLIFINCFRLMNVFIALIISTAMAAMPYLIMRLRLEKVRSLSSDEAELLISELLIKYKIKNFNIEEAIEEILHTEGLTNTKQLLSKLLVRLRTTRVDGEIKDATRIFAYSINTNWSRMLASNVYQSSKSGINVSLSMEDILVQLREARKLKEKRKRDMAEPKQMLWSMPIFYFVLYFLGSNFMGADTSHYLSNQFGTPQGLILMCLIIIGFFISYFCISLLKSRKLDY